MLTSLFYVTGECYKCLHRGRLLAGCFSLEILAGIMWRRMGRDMRAAYSAILPYRFLMTKHSSKLGRLSDP